MTTSSPGVPVTPSPRPPSTLPAAFSVLNLDALGVYLQEQYPLAAPVSCELLSAGLNDTYLVHTAQGRFVYRLYRPSWRSEAEVCWEMALLAHLQQQQAHVSTPIPTREGAHAQWVSVPEGRRLGALFTFVPGSIPKWQEAGDGQLFGASVAALHDAMASFQDPGGRFHLDVAHLIDGPLAVVLPLLGERPDDAALLADLGARARARLAELASQGLSVGVCHGDPHGHNSHLHEGVWTHFDFDCGGPGWRVYDLAVFWWSLSLEKKSADVWEAFLDGYGRDRLTPADWAALPWFVVARTLWSLGLQAGLRPKIGKAFLSGDHYWQEYTDFLRTWDAERLGGTRGPETTAEQES